jgi:hypothetical protein
VTGKAKPSSFLTAEPKMERTCSTVLGNAGDKIISSPALLGERGLFKLKHCAAYNLTVDQDVDAVRTDSECARVQIVNVLAAIDPEV